MKATWRSLVQSIGDVGPFALSEIKEWSGIWAPIGFPPRSSFLVTVLAPSGVPSTFVLKEDGTLWGMVESEWSHVRFFKASGETITITITEEGE